MSRDSAVVCVGMGGTLFSCTGAMAVRGACVGDDVVCPLRLMASTSLTILPKIGE